MATDTADSVLPQGSQPLLQRLRRWIRKDPIQLFLYIMAGAILLVLIYAAGTNIVSGEFTFERFLRLLIFGLAQGSIYALIALGYTLVYGILGMINFAHGEVFMSGAYIGFFAIYPMAESGFLASQPLLALLITLFTGMTASAIVAILLERIAYRPLRNAPRLVPLITAIGASVTLQQLFLRLFGGSTRTYPDLNLYVLSGMVKQECTTYSSEGIHLGINIARPVFEYEKCLGIDLIRGIYDVNFLGMDLRLRPLYFIVFFLAIFFMAVLWFVIQRTKIGKAMRAVAEDKDTAALMGIDVDRIIVFTFVTGAVLAGAAAVLFALYNRQVSPFMGINPGIKAFTAAVLGGIGNIPGAMFGGFFLGTTESVAPALLGIPSQLEDVIAFGMLVLVLIFRPTGIFGEVLSKKKA